MFLLLQIIFFNLFTLNHDAHAWGKRGHQIVGEVAALVASTEQQKQGGTPLSSAFLKDHSFDFGFYNNVPDIVWKKPQTYALENTNHFMDMEIFERAFQKKSVSALDVFKLSREEFEKKFPDVEPMAGRSFWRIQEIMKSLEKTTLELKKSTEKIQKQSDKKKKEDLIKAHRQLQEKWLVYAGVVGHYVADLAQPLHITENYDGQLTHQKGLHHIYETVYVDELYPDLLSTVHKKTLKQWPQFKKQHSSKSTLDLISFVTDSSREDLKEVLKLDKKVGRKTPSKDARKFKKSLERHLTLGSLALAELYRRNLGWMFFGDKFYFFESSPEFITPGSNLK